MGNETEFEFKVGDRVEWHGPGTIRGRIRQRLIAPMEIKGHHVAASDENPQYLVVSDASGEEAAHKPSALRKVD